MTIKSLMFALALVATCGVASAQSMPALDDPNTVTTVMQFTAKDGTSIPELKKSLAAIGQFVAKQPTCIDNVFLKNLNDKSAPQFVGVARWQSIKDWEALWLNKEFQKLVGAFSSYGTLTPGLYAPVKGQ